MLLYIAIILLVLWLFGLIALPSVGGLVYVLLILAIVLLLFHFLRGRRV